MRGWFRAQRWTIAVLILIWLATAAAIISTLVRKGK